MVVQIPLRVAARVSVMAPVRSGSPWVPSPAGASSPGSRSPPTGRKVHLIATLIHDGVDAITRSIGPRRRREDTQTQHDTDPDETTGDMSAHQDRRSGPVVRIIASERVPTAPRPNRSVRAWENNRHSNHHPRLATLRVPPREHGPIISVALHLRQVESCRRTGHSCHRARTAAAHQGAPGAIAPRLSPPMEPTFLLPFT